MNSLPVQKEKLFVQHSAIALLLRSQFYEGENNYGFVRAHSVKAALVQTPLDQSWQTKEYGQSNRCIVAIFILLGIQIIRSVYYWFNSCAIKSGKSKWNRFKEILGCCHKHYTQQVDVACLLRTDEATRETTIGS